MTISGFSRNMLCSCVTAVMLAGCGVLPLSLSKGQDDMQPPIGASGATTQTSAIATHAERGTSWMAPDAKNQDLLYVANRFIVSVYSYPRGKLEGKLKGFLAASGECVDKEGAVFVTSEVGGNIVEYAHGGTMPIETLPAAAEHPLGCAVDPTTGNLAVTTFGNESGSGNLAIYPHAKGSPTTYTDPDILRYYLCGYDDKGNLFVDGLSPPNSGGHFVLAELPKGSGAFTNITLNQRISLPGGVQWDGKDLALADQDTSVIYQFRISGSGGTKVHLTRLGRPAFDVFQFYIDGRIVIAPNDYSIGSKSAWNVLYYRYPAGGTPIRTISKADHEPRGVVVSKASR